MMQWWETGVLENTYVKVDDKWKIKKLAYLALRRTGNAEVRPNKTDALNITLPRA